MKITRKDVIKDNQVNTEMLQVLVARLEEQVIHNIPNIFFIVMDWDFSQTPSVEMVTEFLDELALNSVAKQISYQDKELDFKGIKHSQTTDIFYKMQDGKLFKFPAYKRNLVAKQTFTESGVEYTNMDMCWQESDFKDINGMSEFWVDATEDQIKRFGL